MASSNKGRFSERLKNIARSKRKKNNDDASDFNIKRILVLPLAFFKGVFLKDITVIKNNNIDIKDNNGVVKQKINEEKIKEKKSNYFYRKNIKNTANKINKKNGIVSFSNKRLKNKQIVSNNSEVNKDNKINDKEKKLEVEIINLIKKNLVKQINEYEVLQGDLFVLKELVNDDVYYNKCVANIKEIKKLLSKINALKNKYDYLKDNVDFEYLLEINDNSLIDKIIELRELVNSNKLLSLVSDYKLLEEYKYLYNKIDKMQEDALNLEKYKNDKLVELKERDINFDKFKEKVIDFSKIESDYINFVNRQNIILVELNEKVGKINSFDKIEYSLVGMNKIISNSFKYLGLLLISPFKGLIPSIAVQTMVTKRFLGDAYKNLHLEEHHKTIYNAIDYSSEIDKMIHDLNYTSNVIDNTLSDIIRLKSSFNSELGKYQSNFPQYKDMIKKLNKIENVILGNKIKINIAKQKVLQNEKVNKDKMKKVRKLNNDN